MKIKFTVMEIIELMILLAICTLMILFFTRVLPFNILAIIIAILAIVFAIAVVIDDAYDQRKRKHIIHIPSKSNTDELMDELQNTLNKLAVNNKVIDSVQIKDIEGPAVNEKEVYIIYH